MQLYWLEKPEQDRFPSLREGFTRDLDFRRAQASPLRPAGGAKGTGRTWPNPLSRGCGANGGRAANPVSDIGLLRRQANAAPWKQTPCVWR